MLSKLVMSAPGWPFTWMRHFSARCPQYMFQVNLRDSLGDAVGEVHAIVGLVGIAATGAGVGPGTGLGDGVTGDGVTGDGVTGEGVTGEGVTGEGVTGEGVTGEGVTGEGAGFEFVGGWATLAFANSQACEP